MEWFKHDSSASSDAKIKKLLIKYGTTGYAIYFHCLELICSDVNKNNLTFQLEHDSEIIADNLKIKGSSEQSGIEIVEEIMRYIINLGLFESDGNRIFCMKLLNRIDTSMTSSYQFRKMITDAKEGHDAVMIPSCEKEEIRLDKKRIENKSNKLKKHKYGEYKHVLLTDEEYAKLKERFSDVDKRIKNLDEGIEMKGYKYKNHYLTVLKWAEKDMKEQPKSTGYTNEVKADDIIKF